MAESDLHLKLKRAAFHWLWESGYTAVADEVEVPGVGIIDVAACGRWRRQNPRRAVFQREPIVDRYHVVFVECKAMRADFLRDQGRQQQFAFALADRALSHRRQGLRRPRHASPALGKFDTCLVRPHANLHYLLTPPKLVQKGEIPRRWGWLVWEDRRIRVVRKAAWQELIHVSGMEGAIARSLTLSRVRAWTRTKSVSGSDVEGVEEPSLFSTLLPT